MAAAAATATDSSAVYDAINKAGAAASTAKNDKMSETQDRFLKLLTTQLRNQDPLNPLDNAQMTSQMAQISTVDGITKLNATLQKLINNAADSQTMQAAALVGRAVLVPGSAMALTKDGGIAGVEVASPADQVTVTVKDDNGIVVRTLKLGEMKAGAQTFQWDGKTDNGAAAAEGNYTFSVAAVRGGEEVKATALNVGLVGSVERGANGTLLNVGNLGAFTLADVREIL